MKRYYYKTSIKEKVIESFVVQTFAKKAKTDSEDISIKFNDTM